MCSLKQTLDQRKKYGNHAHLAKCMLKLAHGPEVVILPFCLQKTVCHPEDVVRAGSADNEGQRQAILFRLYIQSSSETVPAAYLHTAFLTDSEIMKRCYSICFLHAGYYSTPTVASPSKSAVRGARPCSFSAQLRKL